MHVWKLTTLVLACTCVWLGWPEETEARHPSPRARALPDTPEPSAVEDVVSADIDVIAAMRAGDVELAQRSLLDARPRVSRAAIETLARYGASDVLVEALAEKDAPPWRIERVVRALGWIGDELSVRTLSDLIDDDDEGMAYQRIAIIDAVAIWNYRGHRRAGGRDPLGCVESSMR